ncbi:MAG: DUF3160 domain-containing protein, partial [Anaerolineaceae bacterium]|nr:DUF3160 domain-containing protein [Anaerolineaceae bacterium]
MKKNRFWAWASGIIVLTLMLSACNLSNLISQKINEETPITGEPNDATEGKPDGDLNAENVYGSAFASYEIQQVNLPDVFEGGYTLPLTGDQVIGLDNEDLPLSDAQRQAILTNGFVVLPPASDPNKIYSEFYQLYESFRYSSLPVFVTTDSVFHVYHLIFDKMLRDLEKTSFIPILNELTTAMLESSISQYESLKGTDLEEAALRNV